MREFGFDMSKMMSADTANAGGAGTGAERERKPEIRAILSDLEGKLRSLKDLNSLNNPYNRYSAADLERNERFRSSTNGQALNHRFTEATYDTKDAEQAKRLLLEMISTDISALSHLSDPVEGAEETGFNTYQVTKKIRPGGQEVFTADVTAQKINEIVTELQNLSPLVRDTQLSLDSMQEIRRVLTMI